jgi:hypothetical protein
MNDKTSSLPTFLHWFSWTISVIASVFFLVDTIKGGVPYLLVGKEKYAIVFLSFLFVAIAGCLLTFFKRKAGGIMMLLGGLILVIILYLLGGSAQFGMMVIYGLPYIFSGAVFLAVK